MAELERIVDAQGAGRWVECAGPRFGAEKEQLLDEAAVFCIPSRYESFGYSLMEGMSAGLPILVGEGCCVTSYFSPEERAALVVGPSVDAWVEAIRNTLKDPGENLDCVSRRRQAFKAACGSDRVGVSLRKVYAELLNR